MQRQVHGALQIFSSHLRKLRSSHGGPTNGGRIASHCIAPNVPFGNGPARIPRLYRPTKQSLEMFIFGSRYSGWLDPGDHRNCISRQLYNELQKDWPESYPRGSVPLHFCPNGPAALYLPKDDCSASFIVGSQGWRILRTTATRAMAGEFDCASRNGLSEGNLKFLYQSLEECGFQQVISQVYPSRPQLFTC